MLNLINDILDLSKIEAGHLEMRPETISVERLANNLRQVFQPLATEKQLDLSIELSADCPANIETDPQRLEQVLKNLVSHLEPGSSALWIIGDSAPYGVYVDTPALIGELASAAGFDLREDLTLRARGDRWATAADRHQVPLTERLLVLTARRS